MEKAQLGGLANLLPLHDLVINGNDWFSFVENF
jgi:hypothetical protein